jgi:hypothetical protein
MGLAESNIEDLDADFIAKPMALEEARGEVRRHRLESFVALECFPSAVRRRSKPVPFGEIASPEA